MRRNMLSIAFLAFCPLLVAPHSSFAKEDWQSDLRRWTAASQTDPNCNVRYTIGIYRPDLSDKPVWNFMTEKMFKWFSGDGAKLAPSVCPVSRANLETVKYRILFSQSPMKTVSQTTHGAEVRTTNEPFSAGVSTHTSYSDGGTAESTGTINGQLTTSVVVPTETTISKSSVALYLYVYRVTGDHVELICTDSVVFSRVAASGSGDNAAGAELGAGIGNLIRASGDRHREDRLYQGALNAIRADAEDNGIKRDALPEDHTARVVTAPLPAPVAPSAPQASAQASLVIDSTPPGADIEIDGAFVGNTPSTVTASPGSHQVAVKRKGFTDWTKTLNVTGGTIHLIAELEQAPAVPTQ